MRIQLDNHLYLEEAQGVWYLTSTEPYKVAWKTDIPQLVTAWRHYAGPCSAELKAAHDKNAKLEQELKEAQEKLAAHALAFRPAKHGWSVPIHSNPDGSTTWAPLADVVKAYNQREVDAKAAQDKIAKLEQEVQSWKTGQRCATQHIMKECYESRLNDIADLRKRCDELEAKNAEILKENAETANHLVAGRERLEKIAMQAAQLTGCRKAIKELEDKVAAYEEHVVIGLGQKVLLKHNMAVSLSEALEERRELKVRVFHLEKELKNQKPGPPNVSWVVHGNELQLFHQGVLCCSVDSEGLVRVTGKTLWRSTHFKHYNDVETLYTQAGKLDELAQENKKLAANVREYEALLEGVMVARGEELTVTHKGKPVRWCVDGTVKVFAHDATWHDKEGNPHQVASLVAKVETLTRELALARPTFDEWVERIKKARGFKVQIATKDGAGISVYACLSPTSYMLSPLGGDMLGIPPLSGLDSEWQVWKYDPDATNSARQVRDWVKKQKVQE